MLLDGTLLPIDRIAADGPYYFEKHRKHRKHGMNVQVIVDPFGRLLWVSPALPGAVHDVRAAREHGIVTTLADAGITCWADKAYQAPAAQSAFPTAAVGRRSPSASKPSTAPTPESGPWSSRPSPPSNPGGSCASSGARPTASPAWSRPSSPFTWQRPSEV